MRIIDAHAHLIDEPGYLDGLLAAMGELGIEKTILSGLGPLFGLEDNAGVAAAVRAHPDRIAGFGYVRPGVDPPELVETLARQGFVGVKITCPSADYCDKSFYPIWDYAQARGLPVLFHTGIVTAAHARPEDDISSARMKPIFLEPIARAFPKLQLICAHLGIHWNVEAAEIARMLPNVYVDLTGEPAGFRSRLRPADWRRFLWWPGAFDKVVFGSDVHYAKLPAALAYDRRLYRDLRLPKATRERIYHGNIEAIAPL